MPATRITPGVRFRPFRPFRPFRSFFSFFFFLVALAVLSSGAIPGQQSQAADLAEEFLSPPDSARMWTWWFWLGDKVDEASITLDLEALKAQGMSGVTVYSLSGPGVADRGPSFMSPEWRALFRHTVKEAGRLGLGVSAVLCSGWNVGGPWIAPEIACKRHVRSELLLEGPRPFRGHLPKPPGDPRYYRDIAVQAFPLAKWRPSPSASSSHPQYPVSNAFDGNEGTFWVSNGERPDEGPKPDRHEWLQLDLGEVRPVKRLIIRQRPGYGPRDAVVQVSTDERTFTPVKSLAMGRDEPVEVELPGTPVIIVRLEIASTWSPERENVQVIEFSVDGIRGTAAANPYKTLEDSFGHFMATPIAEVCRATTEPLPPEEPGTAIDPAAVIDLTPRCGVDGMLEWEVPEGRWIVLRTGVTLTGAMTSCSSPTGMGLEGDPLDPAAIDAQFANIAGPMLEDAGALAGKVFRSVQIDSWEIGIPNWTVGFLDRFRELRGYDPRPYLPALGGFTIGSAALTDRFLHDYRRALADLVAENCFGRLTRLAEEKGIVQQSEAGGVCCPKVMALDALKNLGRCAIPMGEFWQDGSWVEANQNKNGKQTASAAHLYGKRVVAAEAFTSFLHWTDSPASLKPTADRAFCEGLNWFFIFSSATRSGEGVPGTEYFAGTYFNRKITWWNQARSFADYIARTSHLLQSGLFVADVLFYNGDACPNYVSPKRVDPSLGPGYDYDVANTEVLLERLSVRDGRLVLPDGMSYRLLVLPEGDTVPVEVLRKLEELVSAGATVIGPRPERAPGLKDYPRCDEEIRTLAAELWGDCDGARVKEHAHGKGRVVWGHSAREVLASAGVPPDLAYADVQPGAFLDWIHRRAGDTEIYFIANRLDRAERATCIFRVDGKQPEIWDPVSGATRDAGAFLRKDGLTQVPMEFAPWGSVFVVFRKAAGTPSAGTPSAESNFPAHSTVREIVGPWTVDFDPRWGGPGAVEFAKLEDWTTRPEEGVRHYSGTAVYRTRFEFLGRSPPPNGPARGDGPRFALDLGVVKDLAQVRLNGKELGVVWTEPRRVDLTGALRSGNNELEIRVTNLWPNRLIGDAALPRERRLTWTNIEVYKKDSKLLPSGLLGPVTILER